MRANLVEVVKDRSNGPAFSMPALDQQTQIFAGPPIDRGEWLIEQDQLGILYDQPSEEDALELTD